MKDILWLKEISKKDVNLAGGKGAQLGELFKSKFPVPNGFVISSLAYKNFIKNSNLNKIIIKNLTNLDVENTKKLENIAIKLQNKIILASLSSNLQKEILSAYKKLKGNVAVRSSATAEDLPTASFAGQQATYLNIKGNKELIKAVKKCFASLFTARAIYYRSKNNFDHSKVLMSVVVQKMVKAKKAGVIFSINPLSNNRREMVIESVSGLGEALVSGSISPDSYVIDKTRRAVKEKHIVKTEILSNKELNNLIVIAKKIEKHYKFPQDIEWTIDDKIYIVQTRPITTTKQLYSKAKWKKILSREYGVQYTEISLRCLTKEAKDLVPYNFYEQIYIPEDVNEVCYIDEDKWNKLILNLRKIWNINNVKKFENLFIKTGNQYMNYSKKLSKINLKNKSPKELKKFYLQYQKFAVRYTSFIWTAFILNDFFSEKVRNVIEKYVKDKKDANLYHEVLLSPVKKASILKLASIVNNKNINKKIISKLYDKFKWIPCLDIHNPPWAIKEFEKHLKQIKSNKNSQIPYKSALENLKINLKDKKVLDTAKRFAYIKDLRDDFRRQAIYYAQISLFNDLARRMNIPINEISYLQEQDIIDFLDNKNIKFNKIRERKNGFVIFFDSNKKLRCVSGNEVKSAVSKLGLSSGEDFTTEIKGIPASKGIVQGKVTIVKGVNDLYKVNGGDILVAVTTHPDYVPAMQKTVAIVTDEGGVTSHAAIVARELGVPCIVGTKTASKILKNKDRVEVDANIGLVRKIKI